MNGNTQVQTKPWYASKTIWGGIIALIAAVLSLFGHQIDPQTQKFITDQAVQIATAIAAAVGGGLAIYGRIKAEKKVKL